MSKPENVLEVLYCSFCGQHHKEVKYLIAGPGVFICDTCVELCNEIIRDKDAEHLAKKENEEEG